MCLTKCLEKYGSWVLSLCFLLVWCGVEGEASIPQDQPYRTGFHFQPSKNWINDPNGPMYYKGVYHLFYQYNPYGPLWGNITWGHSISYDLVNWVQLENALKPDKPYDIKGCWSGSATILPEGEPVILYTGGDKNDTQLQNLAFPKNLSDPFLREWIKSSHNPLLTPGNGIGPNLFRDPSTAWLGQDGLWRIVIGSQIENHGIAVLYKSKDFVHWVRTQNPLHYSNKTGMWECPDFYPVSVEGGKGLDMSVQRADAKYVLKASYSGHDCYIIGNYDHRLDRFVTADNDFIDTNMQLRYDYGKFYASKSFFDSAKQRRILWAWISEGDSQSDDVEKGWSGLQSFPRSIWLSKNGRQLMQWPVEEIEKLRRGQVSIKNKELKGGSSLEIVGITASQADVEVSFTLPNLDGAEAIDPNSADPQLLCTQKNASVKGSFGPFGLLVLASKDLKEQTAVFFRVFTSHNKNHVVLMCSDQSRSSLRQEVDKSTYGAFLDLDPQQENISLRSLIDHSIVESFGGEGRACMTARVYPKLAVDKQAYLYVFNYGSQRIITSSINAWSMKKAQITNA